MPWISQLTTTPFQNFKSGLFYYVALPPFLIHQKEKKSISLSNREDDWKIGDSITWHMKGKFYDHNWFHCTLMHLAIFRLVMIYRFLMIFFAIDLVCSFYYQQSTIVTRKKLNKMYLCEMNWRSLIRSRPKCVNCNSIDSFSPLIYGIKNIIPLIFPLQMSKFWFVKKEDI